MLARRGQRQPGATRSAPRRRRRVRDGESDGLIQVLAQAVREVEAAVTRAAIKPSTRTKFQVVALLVREERARVNGAEFATEAYRTEQLRRLDGIATILAKTAALEPSLLGLLAEDAVISEAAAALRRQMLEDAGMEAPEEPEP
ncbi:MAG TPA: ATP-dependent helicase, partial [Kribbella sp.]